MNSHTTTTREEHDPLINTERTEQKKLRQEIIDQLVYRFDDYNLKQRAGLEIGEITIDKLFFIGKPRKFEEKRSLHTEYLNQYDKNFIDNAVRRYQRATDDPTPVNGNFFDRLVVQDKDADDETWAESVWKTLNGEKRDNEFCAMTFCKQEFDRVITKDDFKRETDRNDKEYVGLKGYKEKLEKWEAAETLLQYQVQLVDVLKQRHRNERTQTFYNRDKTKEYEKLLEKLEKKLIGNLECRKRILKNWKNIQNIENNDKTNLENKISEYTARITDVNKIITTRIERDKTQEEEDPSDVVEVSRSWNEVLLDGFKSVIDVAKAIKDGNLLSRTWDKIAGFGEYLVDGVVYLWDHPIEIPRGIIKGSVRLYFEAEAAIYQLQIWWTSGRLFGPLRLERIIDLALGIKEHAEQGLRTLHEVVKWGGISYLFNFTRDLGIVLFVEPLRPVYGSFHDWLKKSKRDWVNYIADELLPKPSRRSPKEMQMSLGEQVGKRTWGALIEDGWRKASKLYNLYNDGLWGYLTNLTVILLMIFLPPVGLPLALVKGIINTLAFFGDVLNESIVALHDYTDYSYLYFENKERMELQDKTITYLKGKNNLEAHEKILLADLIKEKRNCELLQEQLYKNFVAHSAEPSDTFLGTIANGIKAAWASWTSSVMINRFVRMLPGVTVCLVGMILFFFVPGGQLPGAILAFVGGSLMTGFMPRVINFFRDEFPKLVDAFRNAAAYAEKIWDEVILDNNSNNVINAGMNTGKDFPPRTSDSPSGSPNNTPNSSSQLKTSSSEDASPEHSLESSLDSRNVLNLNFSSSNKSSGTRKEKHRLAHQSESSDYTNYTSNDLLFNQRQTVTQSGSQSQLTPRKK